MVDDRNTTRQQADDGTGGESRPNTTTPPPSPSRTPRRSRRGGTTPASRPSQAAPSSTTPPPPPTPPADRMTTSTAPPSATRHPMTPGKRKSVICPICHKDMCHEKALCGHIRWHTQEERQAASMDIARALASSFPSGVEDEGSSKRFKVPDLNKPPPPEDHGGS